MAHRLSCRSLYFIFFLNFIFILLIIKNYVNIPEFISFIT